MEENLPNQNYSNNYTSFSLIQNMYDEKLDKNYTNNSLKKDMSFLFESNTEKIISTFESILNKTDKMILKYKSFKDYFDTYLTDMTEINSNLSINNENKICCLEQHNKNLNNVIKINDKLRDISLMIEKLDESVQCFNSEIKNKIEEIKDLKKEKSISEKQENKDKNIINININSIDQVDIYRNKQCPKSNTDVNVVKNIFIQNAESKFGLDNQFEFVDYNKDII